MGTARCFNMVLEVNTRVWAIYKGETGNRKFYTGKIAAVNADQTYEIHVSQAARTIRILNIELTIDDSRCALLLQPHTQPHVRASASPPSCVAAGLSTNTARKMIRLLSLMARIRTLLNNEPASQYDDGDKEQRVDECYIRTSPPEVARNKKQDAGATPAGTAPP